MGVRAHHNACLANDAQTMRCYIVGWGHDRVCGVGNEERGGVGKNEYELAVFQAAGKEGGRWFAREDPDPQTPESEIRRWRLEMRVEAANPFSSLASHPRTHARRIPPLSVSETTVVQSSAD